MESSCNLLPINVFTSRNISFNASITYSDPNIQKPFIFSVMIKDSEENTLVRCAYNTPCSFRNTFEERALRIDGDDPKILDTLLIAVQNVSFSDTGSYFLIVEYFKNEASSKKQKYTGTVHVNVTLAEEGK